MPSSMSVAEYLVRALEQEGVRHAFGVHGSALTRLIDHVAHDSGITPVLVRHEEGGAFMADGYARFSGKIGFCWGTSGPGTTNLLTGLATSFSDAIPVLAVAGQVPTAAFYRGAFQESTSSGVDSVGLLRGVTKFAELMATPEQAPVLVKKALRIALTGRRGPTALVIPRNCLEAEIEGPPPPVFSYRVGNRCYDARMVGRAAEILVKAERPAILAGTGVSLSGANQQLLSLASELGAAVAATPKAKGCFPEDHPLSLGVLGFGGHPSARRYLLREADLILAVGTSLGQISTENFHPRFEEIPLIQVDVDAYEIGKNFPVRVGLVGDAQVILRELSRALAGLPRDGQEASARAHLEAFKHENPRYVDAHLMRADAVPIYPQRAMAEIRKALPRDAIVYLDSGNHTLWGLHYLDAYEPRTLVDSSSFGAMGYGVCAAIGAQLACPERTVVSICGDGGFLMNGMDVSTAVNYRIPVIWVVLNNHSLGMVYHGLEALAGRRSGGKIDGVDLTRIAEGLGARALSASSADELRAALRRAQEERFPTVIDLEIDAEQIPPVAMLRPELAEVA